MLNSSCEWRKPTRSSRATTKSTTKEVKGRSERSRAQKTYDLIEKNVQIHGNRLSGCHATFPRGARLRRRLNSWLSAGVYKCWALPWPTLWLTLWPILNLPFFAKMTETKKKRKEKTNNKEKYGYRTRASPVRSECSHHNAILASGVLPSVTSRMHFYVTEVISNTHPSTTFLDVNRMFP